MAKRNERGFTMIELLITLAIVLLIGSLAVPAMSDFFTTYQLKSAASAIYNDMRLAQTEAKQRRINIYFAYQTGSNWCYGINDNATCSCTVSNACQLNGSTKVESSANYSGITLAANTGNTDMRFDSLRGTIDNPVTFTLSKNGKSASVTINAMGEASID